VAANDDDDDDADDDESCQEARFVAQTATSIQKATRPTFAYVRGSGGGTGRRERRVPPSGRGGGRRDGATDTRASSVSSVDEHEVASKSPSSPASGAFAAYHSTPAHATALAVRYSRRAM
jgi:hypothetical protein